jgi:hypothetical protein
MILEAVKASMTKHFTLTQPLYPEYREGHHRGTLCHMTALRQPFTFLSGHFFLSVTNKTPTSTKMLSFNP